MVLKHVWKMIFCMIIKNALINKIISKTFLAQLNACYRVIERDVRLLKFFAMTGRRKSSLLWSTLGSDDHSGQHQHASYFSQSITNQHLRKESITSERRNVKIGINFIQWRMSPHPRYTSTEVVDIKIYQCLKQNPGVLLILHLVKKCI